MSFTYQVYDFGRLSQWPHFAIPNDHPKAGIK